MILNVPLDRLLFVVTPSISNLNYYDSSFGNVIDYSDVKM
jgi:hypothetical protein